MTNIFQRPSSGSATKLFRHTGDGDIFSQLQYEDYGGTGWIAGLQFYNGSGFGPIVLGNPGVLLIGDHPSNSALSTPCYGIKHVGVVYPGVTSGAFKGGILTGTAPVPSVGGATGAIGVADSVVMSGSNITLSGDATTPGNSKLYGTNGSGTKGWYAQPTTPQAADIGALTDNTAGTANTTLEALADGTVYANDVAAIRNNFADLAAQINLLRTNLRSAGLMA